jgi:DNA-binding CsgD family transcriptional regulator
MNDTESCESLTHSEISLIKELVAGRTREALARRENITVRQMHRRIGKIKRKLGADNDFQIGARAAASGILDLQPGFHPSLAAFPADSAPASEPAQRDSHSS